MGNFSLSFAPFRYFNQGFIFLTFPAPFYLQAIFSLFVSLASIEINWHSVQANIICECYFSGILFCFSSLLLAYKVHFMASGYAIVTNAACTSSACAVLICVLPCFPVNFVNSTIYVPTVLVLIYTWREHFQAKIFIFFFRFPTDKTFPVVVSYIRTNINISSIYIFQASMKFKFNPDFFVFHWTCCSN